MTKIDALKKLLAKVQVGDVDRWSMVGMPFSSPQKSFALRSYNGSLDAAKALHEGVLEGWDWKCGPDVCCVFPSGDMRRSGIWGYDIENNNPARAWLIAIIKALIGEAEGAALRTAYAREVIE